MAVADFGAGLGTIIGAGMAKNDITSGQRDINSQVSNFGGTVAPYNEFGTSFLPTATSAIGGIQQKAGQVQGYEDFMKNYQTSPGAAYQMKTADEAQNESAAAKGGLLSGSNLRELSNINQGISSTYANEAYGNYLKGDQQQFGQLETALGNMFNAIGVGQIATGQEAGVTNAQIGATSQLSQAQAKNDQNKGSGFGSLFSGLTSIASMPLKF